MVGCDKQEGDKWTDKRHAYRLDRYIHHMYIHTYMNTYIHEYIHTYMNTYIRT